MRLVMFGFVAALILDGCAHNAPTKITRYTLNPWEKDIGYAEVVQAGNTYYISGVACDGTNYEQAVSVCYKELQAILTRIKLDAKHVVKENIYARNIDQLKEQIGVRKAFYGNSDYPASTWIQVDRLYQAEHLVEIEWVAVK